jgi:hypothetical protein
MMDPYGQNMLQVHMKILTKWCLHLPDNTICVYEMFSNICVPSHICSKSMKLIHKIIFSLCLFTVMVSSYMESYSIWVNMVAH